MNDQQQQQQQQCNNRVPRGGGNPQIITATILSCGMGGFNCATGGQQPQCFIRCCRIDFDKSGPILCCMPCTCCYCCYMWPYYSYLVHKALGVDFFNKRFFSDYSSDDDADSSSDDSSSSSSDYSNNNKASVTENKTTIMDRG